MKVVIVGGVAGGASASNAFDLEHRSIQDTYHANDIASVKMGTLMFG